MKSTNLTGGVFGHLRVLAQTIIPAGIVSRATRWLCACECGRRTVVARHNLITGHTQSCGSSSCRFRYPYPDAALAAELAFA